MKKVNILITLILSAFASFSENPKFIEAMQKNIAQLYAAQTAAELQNSINVFDRIGAAEKTRWEPFYYSAFGNVMVATKESNLAKKDAALDLAEAAINKAIALKADDSEIVAVEGFIAMMRITVDPPTRGQQYSGSAMQSFRKALSLSPQNPRAIALNGQMQFGMAKFFGNTSTEACASAKKALELLAKENPTDPLAPRWGKGMAENLLKECGM